jgi:hypothetical protein
VCVCRCSDQCRCADPCSDQCSNQFTDVQISADVQINVCGCVCVCVGVGVCYVYVCGCVCVCRCVLCVFANVHISADAQIHAWINVHITAQMFKSAHRCSDQTVPCGFPVRSLVNVLEKSLVRSVVESIVKPCIKSQTCFMFLIKPSLQNNIKRHKNCNKFEIHNNHENTPQVRFLVAETGPDPPRPENGSKSTFF